MSSTTQLVSVGSWKADPVHSSASFEVGHLGVSIFRANFEDFEATLIAGDDSIAVEGAAQVESISVREPHFRDHLLSPEFFDAARYPVLRFESTDVRRNGGAEVSIEGDLTIKGTTLRIVTSGRVGKPGVDPYGNERIALELEAVVDRGNFGIGWNMALPDGKLAVGNDVRLLASLELVRAA